MPSPVGHALGGLIAGWLVSGAPRVDAAEAREVARLSLPFALLAVTPDLDLLVGLHSRYTHSLGAAAIVMLAAAWLVPRDQRHRRWTFAIACGCAYASHVLLDWLGSDTSPPLGIMALWPLSSDFYLSGREWFLATDRRYWVPGFFTRNLQALWRELVVLVPLTVLTYLLRRGRSRVAARSAMWPHAERSETAAAARTSAERRKLPSS